MTYTKSTTLLCDGERDGRRCRMWIRMHVNHVEEVRERAEEQGWDCSVERDLCDQCSEDQ